MSHIPASAMPHARSNGDPATAAPLASQAPATVTGNREGSPADQVARDAGRPDVPAQAPVDGTVTAEDRPSPGSPPKRRSRLRSPAGLAAIAIGGLAVAGGVAATLYPKARGDEKPKSKSRKGPRKKG